MKKLESFLKIAVGVAFLVALGLGVWLRVTSLESMPDHLGDESFYGLQLLKLYRGEPFTIWTTSGNLMIYPILQAPLLLIFRPSLWILRAPAALCGVLAFALMYPLGRRVLDRPTAAIAAALLAVLPTAIVFSRFGCEFAVAPLACLVCLHYALRGSGRGTLISGVVAIVVYQATIFLGPAVVGVYFVQALRRTSGDPSARRRLLIQTAMVSGVVVAVVGALTFARPVARSYYGQKYHGLDWSMCLVSLGRFFVADWTMPARQGEGGAVILTGYDLGFWGLVGSALLLGGWRLWRERRWERLALVAGTAVGAAGLHVVGGPTLLVETWRYGVFLLVPATLSLACLVSPLLLDRTAPGRGVIRQVQLLAVLALAWPMLGLVYQNWFAWGGRESIWTLRTESGEPHRDLAALIASEAKPTAAGGGPLRVLAQDWATYPPQAFYLHGRPGLQIEHVNEWAVENTEEGRDTLREVVRNGGLAVQQAGGAGEDHVRAILPVACLLRSELPGGSGDRFVSVYRRNLDVPAPADYDGDGKADPAVYRAESGTWEIQLAGGEVRLRLGEPGPAIPAPGDYDGDGKAEPAVSHDGRGDRLIAGLDRATSPVYDPLLDLPLSGDFDGDGRTDLAAFSSRTAAWLIRYSGGGETSLEFGRPGHAIPVPADYDGDGKTDIAFYDAETSSFHMARSSDQTLVTTQFGMPNRSIPVPADYDGDGRADLAVFQPPTADWLVLGTQRGPSAERFGFGNRDIPTPADYDGDGRADLAVFRPTTGEWLVRASGAGDRQLAFAPSDQADPRTLAEKGRGSLKR